MGRVVAVGMISGVELGGDVGVSGTGGIAVGVCAAGRVGDAVGLAVPGWKIQPDRRRATSEIPGKYRYKTAENCFIFLDIDIFLSYIPVKS